LQQRAVVPVGSHQEIPVDVRVVAATNRDLGREVADRRFREDLFYRLNVVAIQTMPLSDRPEDVPVLAARFLAELAVRHGMPLCTLSSESVDLLQQYSWPGNVRELENVLERAVLFATCDVIEPELLGGLIGQATLPLVAPAVSVPAAARRSGQELQEAARLGVVSVTGVAGVYRVEPKGFELADACRHGACPSRADACRGVEQQVARRKDAGHRSFRAASQVAAARSRRLI
jgi:transcriptional regulator with PAS, ATPase and Fis domain